MRLTTKKIEEVITSILGEEGLLLVNALLGKANVSEFDLAKQIKRDIKIVRKMLYILYNNNLIGFNRKKDKQKGWYIYYWTLLPENIKFLYFKIKKSSLQSLKNQLEEEQEELFFICPKQCLRLNFDRAIDFEFHCPECGDLLAQEENTEKIPLIKKEIENIEAELVKEIKDQQKIMKLKRMVQEKKPTITKKPVKKEKIATKKKVTKRKPAPKKVVKKKPVKKNASPPKVVSKKKKVKLTKIKKKKISTKKKTISKSKIFVNKKTLSKKPKKK